MKIPHQTFMIWNTAVTTRGIIIPSSSLSSSAFISWSPSSSYSLIHPLNNNESVYPVSQRAMYSSISSDVGSSNWTTRRSRISSIRPSSSISSKRNHHSISINNWCNNIQLNIRQNGRNNKSRLRQFSSSSSSSGGNNNNNKDIDGKDIHNVFMEQMQELNDERTFLFGRQDENNDDPLSIPTTSTTQQQQQEQNEDGKIHQVLSVDTSNLNDLKKEREALYDFSLEEKRAWGNVVVNNDDDDHSDNSIATSSSTTPKFRSHSPELMKQIQEAREAKKAAQEAFERQWEKDQSAKEGQQEQVTIEESTTIPTTTTPQFTHINPNDGQISMVDVGKKQVTERTAKARSIVIFPPEVMKAFDLIGTDGDNDVVRNEIVGPKGSIFSTAKIAGIMGAKRTSDLIPLCHPLPINKVNIDIQLVGNKAIVECECRVNHTTGVEMEALTGASIASLTIYDMVKAVSHRVVIGNTELISKTGGKRDIRPTDDDL